ncbi:TIGR03089 family protein [Streptomyces sp. NPDC050560]|uniref:TIGR03089 family protein n=1 Tax=Streptomyces sp. NPDC050560 TaxID=3365630 RepID=UPI00379C6389
MTDSDRTPADLLRSEFARNPARPLVTFYDDATGERVELSVATFANWVSKTANLLQGDLAAEPGDRLALLLPAHWQTAVWLIAASAVGVVADVGGDPAAADLVVSGPDTLEAARGCRGERIALALRPLGGRFPEPPGGFMDYAAEVPGQGDRFAPLVPPEPTDAALVVAGAAMSAADVTERARADAAHLGLTGPGSRLLSTRAYDTWEGLSAGLYAPLAAGASVVLVRNAGAGAADGDGAAMAKRVEEERVTATAR